MVCLGICIPAWMALPIPILDSPAAVTAHENDWVVTSYWRYIWLMPVLFAVIQTIGLLTCFKFESPVELKKAKKMDVLHNLMSKMYEVDLVEARIEAIAGVGEDDGEDEEDEEGEVRVK